MDNRPKKELIDGIKEALKGYEETYDRREWKNFQRQRVRNRHRPIALFLKLSGIAASLFLVVYASVKYLPFFDTAEDSIPTVPTETLNPERPNVPQTLDTGTVDLIVPLVDHTVQNGINKEQLQEPVRTLRKVEILERPIGASVDRLEVSVGNLLSIADSVRIDTLPRAVPKSTSTLIGNHTGNKETLKTKSRRTKRFHFPKIGPLWNIGLSQWDIAVGFNVTPVYTGQGFGLGGGVSAHMPLSHRLSTEIGINYMNLKVGFDRKADMRDTISMQVVGVEHAVGMVALPIKLNYAISENLSASVGITPLRVVRDQRTDILQSYKWVSGNMSSADSTGRLLGETTRMRRPDSLYMGNTYWGFIELSGRYSPPILQKRNVVLAPFISFPIGRLRNDENRWFHGGMSIRYYLR